VVELLLLPPGDTTGRGGRPEKHPRWVILDAIFFVVRGGIAWRQVLADFSPAMTVSGLFRRWARTRGLDPGP
jgi:transposase